MMKLKSRYQPQMPQKWYLTKIKENERNQKITR